ncbi:hypothetical protein HK405_000711, partial [Cladochytrium tenue]
TARTGSTLEKDPSALDVKKIDREFLVDPLFKKTSADFDEGSASGLLLNHLSMSCDGRIVFDASDDTSARRQMDDNAEASQTAVRATVPIGRLRAEMQPFLQSIWERSVCPSLRDFSFGPSDAPLPAFAPTWASAPGGGTGSDSDADDGDYGGFDGDAGDDGGGGEGSGGGGIMAHILETAEAMDYEDGAVGVDDDVDANGSSLVLRQASLEPGERGPNPNAFSYFDSKLMKRWAGPGFWKPNPFKGKFIKNWH